MHNLYLIRGPIIPVRFAVFEAFSSGFSVCQEIWCSCLVLQTVAACGNGHIFDTVFGFYVTFISVCRFSKKLGLKIFPSELQLANFAPELQQTINEHHANLQLKIDWLASTCLIGIFLHVRYMSFNIRWPVQNIGTVAIVSTEIFWSRIVSTWCQTLYALKVSETLKWRWSSRNG